VLISRPVRNTFHAGYVKATMIGSAAREPRHWNPIILTNGDAETMFLSIRSNLPKPIEAVYIDTHVILGITFRMVIWPEGSLIR
jgi:hypothetical protein